MANQQAVKQRIKSVGNTKQITKAMQLVASSKLRKAQEQAIGPKEFIVTAKKLLSSLAWHPDAYNNPLFKEPKSDNVLTVIISSDRGLAGAYNANVLKATSMHLKATKGQNSVITIGKYASRFIARIKDVNSLGAYELDVDDLDSSIVKPVLTEIKQQFASGEFKAVWVVYTDYISTVKQIVRCDKLFPIEKSESAVSDRTFEPSAEAIFDVALSRLIEAEILQYLLESKASEQASRMLAMKNATDNASDLIGDLTLEYNNARQAKITQELAEISAGAEAIK
jgi:F-type H+-transporting ATPase subunit gamma